MNYLYWELTCFLRLKDKGEGREGKKRKREGEERGMEGKKVFFFYYFASHGSSSNNVKALGRQKPFTSFVDYKQGPETTKTNK